MAKRGYNKKASQSVKEGKIISMTDAENWKPVKGYEGYYEVHRSGEVRSVTRTTYNRKGSKRIKGKLLCQPINNRGYKRVKLYKNGIGRQKFVHRLVAIAHVANPFHLPQVGRRNGNKVDNQSTNLKWKHGKTRQGSSKFIAQGKDKGLKLKLITSPALQKAAA